MITERPLKKVPTRALYALHRGIERRTRLISGELEDENRDVCSVGAVVIDRIGCSIYDFRNAGGNREVVVRIYKNLGLMPQNTVDFSCCEVASYVGRLNDSFMGTPEGRREFMLRHIVKELRQRSKPLPNKGDQTLKILTHET